MLQTEYILHHSVQCMSKDAHSTAFFMVLRNARFQGAREETALLREEEMLETTAATSVLEHVTGAAQFSACAC